MLALSFTFLAGRYHATPWDRHVNEGAVAWPPEPWRLLRALIATWHHKVKYLGKHAESTLAALVESLAAELPHYTLPPAIHGHARHYMPQGEAGKSLLVFDAFAAVARNERLYITWPTLDLPDEQLALLDDLLTQMGYLGRAESWVEAARVVHAPTPDCLPDDAQLGTTTPRLRGEVVTLLAPVQAREYRALRERFLSDKGAARRLSATLPSTLFEALSVETHDLRQQGWSQPPAARKKTYLRPIDALRPKRNVRRTEPPRCTTVRYLLLGKPLPRVEESVRLGELLRMAVMSESRRRYGEDAVPIVFSGHGLPDHSRHQHAFYLPWDANGDGGIDRLLLHVPAGMHVAERRIVESVRRLWDRENGEWQLALETVGDTEAGGALCERATEWRSITPYLHPWHVKKNLRVEDQIRRECRERHLPEPIALFHLTRVAVGVHLRRPIDFRRFRNKRSVNQPDRQGSFWRLTFSEPVQGPLALGFGCHFGLGLFAPAAPVK